VDKLQAEDLYTLESYTKLREEYRTRVMEHKKHRRLLLGDNVLLLFEDRLTIQYQIQEMLRVERIFEEAGIIEELESYNPLIPDGSNWKATLMIQFADPAERRDALERLLGIEDRVWVRVDGHAEVSGIADEDLERATETKTSAVHFLRFELTPPMCAALRNGASLRVGVNHAAYAADTEVPEGMRESLIADLA
jgi:hypothetical protein